MGPDPVIVTDDRGVIVFANAQVEGTFGYSAAELVGRPVEVLLPERLRSSHEGDRKGFFDRPTSRPMGVGLDLRALHRDGHEFPVEISLSPLKTPDGLLVTSAIRDVTRQRETERRLAEADRAKSRFLAAASHDLRQPLQALHLLNKTVARRVGDDDLTASAVEKQRQALDSMTALLNSLLDISKLDAGVVTPRPVDCEVDEILERLRVNHEQQAQEKGLNLSVRSCRATAHTDPDLLQQVLANLVSNSVRYTSEGEIRVSCTDAGPVGLRFEVADTGSGIAREELDRIFEEFYQIDRGTQRPEGLGLGLSIVKRIATLLDYRLEVSSTPGEGTAFAFVVPRGAVRARAESSEQDDARPAGGFILIVDDERPVAEATKMLLEIEGFDVRLATCTSEALEASAMRAPDLIVSDFHLRGGENGLEVVRSVRASMKTDVPVVFVTGDTSKLSAEVDRLVNAAFLAKPLQADELLATVRRQLARRRACPSNEGPAASASLRRALGGRAPGKRV